MGFDGMKQGSMVDRFIGIFQIITCFEIATIVVNGQQTYVLQHPPTIVFWPEAGDIGLNV